MAAELPVLALGAGAVAPVAAFVYANALEASLQDRHKKAAPSMTASCFSGFGELLVRQIRKLEETPALVRDAFTRPHEKLALKSGVAQIGGDMDGHGSSTCYAVSTGEVLRLGAQPGAMESMLALGGATVVVEGPTRLKVEAWHAPAVTLEFGSAEEAQAWRRELEGAAKGSCPPARIEELVRHAQCEEGHNNDLRKRLQRMSSEKDKRIAELEREVQHHKAQGLHLQRALEEAEERTERCRARRRSSSVDGKLPSCLAVADGTSVDDSVLDSARTSITELVDAWQRARDGHAELMARCESAEAALPVLRARAELAEERASASQLPGMVVTATAAGPEVVEMQLRIDRLEQDCRSLLGELHGLNDVVATKDQAILALTQENAQRAELERRLLQAQSDVEELGRHRNAAYHAAQGQAAEQSSLRAEIVQRHEQLQKAQADLEELSRHRDSLLEGHSELKSELESVARHRDSLLGGQPQLHSELESVSRHRDSLLEGHSRLQSELDDVGRHRDGLLAGHSQLQSDLESVSQHRDSLLEGHAQLHSELQSASRHRETLLEVEARVGEVSARHDSLLSERDALEKELSKAASRITELETTTRQNAGSDVQQLELERLLMQAQSDFMTVCRERDAALQQLQESQLVQNTGPRANMESERMLWESQSTLQEVVQDRDKLAQALAGSQDREKAHLELQYDLDNECRSLRQAVENAERAALEHQFCAQRSQAAEKELRRKLAVAESAAGDYFPMAQNGSSYLVSRSQPPSPLASSRSPLASSRLDASRLDIARGATQPPLSPASYAATAASLDARPGSMASLTRPGLGGPQPLAPDRISTADFSRPAATAPVLQMSTVPPSTGLPVRSATYSSNGGLAGQSFPSSPSFLAGQSFPSSPSLSGNVRSFIQQHQQQQRQQPHPPQEPGVHPAQAHLYR